MLALRHAIEVGPRVVFCAERNRKRLLPSITHARPIAVGDGALELHMLLNHARIYEGMWAIYSFAFHAGRHINACIHDDGTLTEQDYASLRKLFPGIRIVDRQTANRQVSNILRRRDLSRSEVFRRDLVLALKLFDPIILCRSKQIAVIDSDVLFFSPPTQFLELADRGANAFSVDFGYSNAYCANLVRIVYPGSEVIPLNSGILTFKAESFRLERIEAHLECPLLWEHGRPHSLAEQAVYGLAFHSLNAELYPNVTRL
jgi:hypothetical protein